MSAVAQRQVIAFSQFDQIRAARAIIQHEAEGLLQLVSRIDSSFPDAIQLLLHCRGRAIVTGVGKAGLVGQKLVATLLSTGTPAQFLHPTEALHGDLGCVGTTDVILAISNSGESEEVCRLLPAFQRRGLRVIALTGSARSTLGAAADVVLSFGRVTEAGAFGLAPSTSTTATLALGDALALVLSDMKGFTREQFAQNHPGGNLGRQLQTVQQVMRRGDELRIAPQHASIRDVLTRHSRPGRRTGAVILVDEDRRLAGLFTDSDLARLLEQRRDEQLDRPVCEVMTRNPITVCAAARLNDVVELLSQRKVSEVPVVDDDRHVLGLVDITDIIGLMPSAEAD